MHICLCMHVSVCVHSLRIYMHVYVHAYFLVYVEQCMQNNECMETLHMNFQSIICIPKFVSIFYNNIVDIIEI